MVVIPIQNKSERDILVIILGGDNLDRMKKADPVQIESCGKTLHNPRIVVCYEEASGELTRLLHNNNLGQLMEYLTRGFEFRPDLGDHDGPPQPIGNNN